MTRLLQKARRHEAGAATVEMAVLMIIFIPLILFTMYASDAVFHTLEVQEAVLVTLWDMSQQAYSQEPKVHKARSGAPGFIEGTVAGFERIQYADHIGEYSSEKEIDSGGTGFGSDSQHHIQIFGHVCWCNGSSASDCDGGSVSDYAQAKAQQVRCQLNQSIFNLTNSYPLSTGATYYSQFGSAGGIVTCSAKGWLYNYLIPETFLGGFGEVNKVKLFNKKRQNASSPHGIESEGEGVGADMLLKFRAQLFVDTWAVVDGSNINRTKNNNMFKDGGVGPNEALFRRTAVVFSDPEWYGSVSGKVLSYAQKAGPSDKKLMIVFSVPEIPPVGFDPPRMGPNPTDWPVQLHLAPDNPLGLIMSLQFPITTKETNGFYTTPYYDEIQQMYDSRKSFYLGFDEKTKTY